MIDPEGVKEVSVDVCVVTNYSDDTKGGASRQARELANRLAADGVTVAFLCRTPTADRSGFSEGVTHFEWSQRSGSRYLRSKLRPLNGLVFVVFAAVGQRLVAMIDRHPSWAPKDSIREAAVVLCARLAAGEKSWLLSRVLRDLNAECVISFITNVNVSVSLALWWTETRIVTSERLDLEDPSRSPFWDQLERFTSRRPDVLTANTVAGARQIEAKLTGRRGEVCVAPNILRFDARVTPLSKRFVVLAQLIPRKRVENVIQAFADSRGALRGWTLVIAGDGPEKFRLLRQASESSVADQISFAGHVVDVPAFLGEGGVLVMASSHEGTPNSLMEAMAFGLPAIVPGELEGAIDLLTAGPFPPAGLVAQDGTAAALAAEMQRIAVDDELRRTLADAGRRRSDLWSWNHLRGVWGKIIDGSGIVASETNHRAI